jgi:uridylate kinase
MDAVNGHHEFQEPWSRLLFFRPRCACGTGGLAAIDFSASCANSGGLPGECNGWPTSNTIGDPAENQDQRRRRLCRPGEFGIDAEELKRIGRELKTVVDLGVELAVVVGGGNIVRGTEIAAHGGIEEVTGHYMGMLGTVINALAVQDTLELIGLNTRVLSAVAVDRVCEKFIRRRAIRHLEKGRVVIFAGGTGNPFVTTDTGAALRASEIGADVLLKATKVDGVYDKDPVKDPSATLLSHLNYNAVIDARLGVMDVAAIDMCQRNRVPVIVFNLKKTGNMRDVVLGKSIGTLVDETGAASVSAGA